MEQKKLRSKTPVRAALKADSPLQSSIHDGLGAVSRSHRQYFDENIRHLIADSLDTDAALRKGREQENRWDYVIGYGPSLKVFAVEPHSAENSEISVVVKKRAAALNQLRDHLRDGAIVSKWLWVASGKVQLLPLGAARLSLAKHGIEFVGPKVLLKHLL